MKKERKKRAHCKDVQCFNSRRDRERKFNLFPFFFLFLSRVHRPFLSFPSSLQTNSRKKNKEEIWSRKKGGCRFFERFRARMQQEVKNKERQVQEEKRRDESRAKLLVSFPLRQGRSRTNWSFPVN